MKVVVTRPQPQADATAQRLRALGHEAIVLPLTTIVPLAPTTLDIASVSYVVATSANALRHAAPPLLRALSPLQLIVVGDRTADVATELGFADVSSAAGDVDALLDRAIASTKPGDVVLYLCGRPRRPDFEAGMKQADRHIITLETYQTEALVLPPDNIAKINDADAVLLYSQTSAHLFEELAVDMPKTILICISQRVANALDEKRSAVVATEPTETAMFAALDRL